VGSNPGAPGEKSGPSSKIIDIAIDIAQPDPPHAEERGMLAPTCDDVSPPAPFSRSLPAAATPRPAAASTAALAAVIGESAALRAVVARAVRLAPHRTSVLVTGESGTGKELFARLLHDHGPAPEGPFVAVNCGALSRELAESELFGHERGAFTGAAGRRSGWFEEAQGGTLVLDEIGELPMELQPKLLRVLETGCLRRVGGKGEIPLRVRVVALTLRNLERDAGQGRFRLDLYHRLSGFELRLPPLRARIEDIPALARAFLSDVVVELGQPRALAPAAMARLCEHPWPGNVRELRNVIRRAACLCDGLIEADTLELPAAASVAQMACEGADAASGPTAFGSGPPKPTSDPPARAPAVVGDMLSLRGRSYEELQKEIFLWALRESGGSRRRAARALQISRSTFCDRVKRLGLVPGATESEAAGPDAGTEPTAPADSSDPSTDVEPG
jgi:DNA-binding NtrC family response regulator